MSEPKKLFLLDAMALIYRAYFALNRNPRINSKGMNTSAVLGFANTLLEVIKKENPTHMAVAFDAYAPTLRQTDFTEYKAHREETPEDIVASLPYIKKLIEGFNMPILELEGYEADDIVGTLAKRAEKDGFTVFMMTSDKDFGQLVSDNIFMYKPARMGNDAQIWGVKEVCENFGIERPEQLIDILGLWGDASDNIPGVPGIGEKKARKLIAEFGSVENLLQNVEKVAEKRSRESLRENAQQALMSKSLATIILDVPVEWDEELFRRKDPNPDILLPLFDELEFRTYAKRVFEHIKEEAPQAMPSKAQIAGQMDLFAGTDALEDPREVVQQSVERIMAGNDFQSVEKEEDIAALIDLLSGSGTFCFDTETTGLDSTNTQLVGIAFCIKPSQAWYVPFPTDQDKAMALAEKFKPLFENPQLEKTGQNLKFDIGVLRNYNISVQGKLFDTMIAHYLLQPDMRHNMDLLAETYLNYRPLSIEALIGKKGKSQKSMRDVPLQTITAYACEDAHVTQQLREVFEPMLKENNLTSLFETMETPLIYVLSEMEKNGVKLDTQALEEYSEKLQHDITQIEQQIYELAGTHFNIGSPKQLGEILFDRLKIVAKAKKTKTKQYSTSEDVLSKLTDKHEIVEKILDYRSLTKLKSTYVDVFPKLISEKTARLHASFNQTVAATGRLSSNNPNLQNIPIRTEQGREIRKAFVPADSNHILLAADYSQIELRIIASLSKDEAMIDAFRQGHDIHAATAARVFGVSLREVDKEMRRKAKTVNFGIVYGISAFGLSERLNIPRAEAFEIIDNYFAQYPGIKRYMDETIEFARKHQYVETILGRRRYIADINSSNGAVRGYAERNAINSPIQGSAADMIKLAMIKIHQQMKQNKLQSRMILQVHDELVFDVVKPELETMKQIVAENMKNAMTLDVELEVDMNTGSNWLEAH
ncbi:MAG: DNA polymerase I [Bacteroidales bacterium]